MIQFFILLGQTYFNQPFINIPVRYAEYFPANEQRITIYLGDWGVNQIIGYVNRTANSNHTPRIMMNANYNDWIQNSFEIGQNLSISFNNPDFPNSILIQ